MVRTYRAHIGKSRQKTYRRPIRGGDEAEEKVKKKKFVEGVQSVDKKLRELKDEEIKLNITHPTSKFIVATYWWGRGNDNKNLQNPCPETINDMVKLEVISRRGKKYGWQEMIAMAARRSELKRNQAKRDLTKLEVNELKAQDAQWEAWKNKVMTYEDSKAIAAELTKRYTDPSNPEYKLTATPRKFEDMIKEWEGKCEALGLNYVQVDTQFGKDQYQTAINGKPVFIKRVLDAVKGKGPNGTDLGVLYIDGDMWMLKYPHIFDIDNVDFMARGWNTDSRSKPKSLKTPAYDPYIFETSGGTMYFGNTETARRLLDKWAQSSGVETQMGKADDRILSQIFTMNTMILKTNMINLPIEYLWLTDNYKEYLKTPADPASIEDVYIEHPYCLTGEERAAGQGAAANREPAGYETQITEMINYERPPELFYEYIFFDGDEKKRDGFARYLKYMKGAKNSWTNQPMMTIVDIKDRYGDAATKIAQGNIVSVNPPFAPGMGGIFRGKSLTPGLSPAKLSDELSKRIPAQVSGVARAVKLPLNAPFPMILEALDNGIDVHLGEMVHHDPEDECVAFDASTREDGINEYTRKLRIDTTKPIFFSAKSSTVRHLIRMSASLNDVNKHIYESYMFMSRIRWNLIKPGTITKPGGVDFNTTVHQIWFGGEMPAWRKAIFDANRDICETYGFKYSLWMNSDRNQKEVDEDGEEVSAYFPQTFAYQETALKKGKETGQSRWAQVADLARLEIVLNSSGIYVDSIIEISPALLLGVRKAIVEGLERGKDVFVGCNEDACEPKLDCKNAKGEMYLSNSFFAATKGNPILKRLLGAPKENIPSRLDEIDFDSTELNHTTGPYFLRSAIKPEDNVVMFDSEQIYQFNQQETPYKGPRPDRFLYKKGTAPVEAIEVNSTMEYVPGGINILQNEFLRAKGVTATTTIEKMEKIVELKGPLAIYHSGLGGTWST